MSESRSQIRCYEETISTWLTLGLWFLYDNLEKAFISNLRHLQAHI